MPSGAPYISRQTDAIIRYGVSTAEMPFIEKPFTAHDLLAQVRDVLKRPA